MRSVMRKFFTLCVVILACCISMYLVGGVLGQSVKPLSYMLNIVTSWLPGSILAHVSNDYAITDEPFQNNQEVLSVWVDIIRQFKPILSLSTKHSTTTLLQSFVCNVVRIRNTSWMTLDVQAAAVVLATWYLSTATLIEITSWVFSPRPRRPASRTLGDTHRKVYDSSDYHLRHRPVPASPKPLASWHRVAYLSLYLLSGVSIGVWWICGSSTLSSINSTRLGESSAPWSDHRRALIENLLQLATEISLSLPSPSAIARGLSYVAAAATLSFTYLWVFVSLYKLTQPPKRKFHLTHSRYLQITFLKNVFLFSPKFTSCREQSFLYIKYAVFRSNQVLSNCLYGLGFK